MFTNHQSTEIQATLDWATFREQMPVAKKWAYLDHAAVAPLPTPTRAAINRWLSEAVHEGDTEWPRWAAEVEATRRSAAQLIGAATDEIALVPNTTAGITLVAEGFPWKPGDNVVTLASEFPSNQYPWLNLSDRAVETRRVSLEGEEVDLQRLGAAIDSRTRVLSVSWVGFATGWRLDLDAVVDMAHRRGVLVLVDAIQGLGVFPLDVSATPVDFLAADGHKWMLGPEGAGLFFIRREHLNRLRPIHVGWNSVAHGNDFSRIELTLRSDAARYEGGSQNMVGMHGLGASLDLLQAFGAGRSRSAIGERVLEVTDLAGERLRSAGATIVSSRVANHRSGIVAFDWPNADPAAMRKHCLSEHVALSCRAGHLRISPHAYNNATDIDRLVDVLQFVQP